MFGDAMETEVSTTTDPATSGMPEIFEIQFMPSDVQNLFSEILQDTPVGEVFNAFSQHIGNNIEPLGWQAIWEPNGSAKYPEGTSFRVNVVDVYYQTLEAIVIIMDLIFPKLETLTGTPLGQISSLLCKKEAFTVPLMDLFVISEKDDNSDSEQFYNTAYLIELTRFFYKNVWRPWDDLDEGGQNEEFVSNRLKPRLTLFWEMKNNLVSKGFIKRFDAILEEAFYVREKINSFNNSIAPIEESAGEMDDFASELDASDYIRWKMKLQDLEREMKIIEDPHLRGLYHTILPEKMSSEEANDEPNSHCIHLVSNKFTFNTLSTFMSKLAKYLEMNNARCSWPIKMHQSLKKALVSSKSGDVVYLSSGVYNEPLAWIENDVEIIGIDNDVQLLSHQDSGDVFLFVNCQSSVKLINLTIKANHQLNHLIVVKHGRLLLDQCKLDCNNMTAHKTILVISTEASVHKQNYTEVNNKSSHSESE